MGHDDRAVAGRSASTSSGVGGVLGDFARGHDGRVLAKQRERLFFSATNATNTDVHLRGRGLEERGVAPFSPKRRLSTSRCRSFSFSSAPWSWSSIMVCSMSPTQSCWLGATRSPNVVAESEDAG